MKSQIENILTNLGFPNDQAGEISIQMIIISLKDTLEELMQPEEFQNLDKSIEERRYDELKIAIAKLDSKKFESEFTKNIVQNIKLILDKLFNQIPEDMKADFLKLVEEIQSKNFAEIVKSKEGKIEDVLKSLAN